MKTIALSLGLFLATCTPPPAYAIYNCWTPEDSHELANKEHYLLVDVLEDYNSYTEQYLVGDSFVFVMYKHPVIGNKKLWCYKEEMKIPLKEVEKWS